LEHTRILGRTLEAIAREKAGMLKPGIPCVCGASRQKVRAFFAEFARTSRIPMTFSKASSRASRIHLSESGSRFDCKTPRASYRDLHLGLIGRHQVDNACLALLAVDELRKQGWNIPEEAVREGFETVQWPARLQLLQKNPKLVLDSAHNAMGVRRLVRALRDIFSYDRLFLLFGVLRDKDYRTMLGTLAPLAHHIVLTKPWSHRALEPERLMRMRVLDNKPVEAIPDIGRAFQKAMVQANEKDLVCAAGSIYFVGEVLRIWESEHQYKVKG
jgi:dihydrofolate synthase/folylpolyglutamate synthase